MFRKLFKLKSKKKESSKKMPVVTSEIGSCVSSCVSSVLQDENLLGIVLKDLDVKEIFRAR